MLHHLLHREVVHLVISRKVRLSHVAIFTHTPCHGPQRKRRLACMPQYRKLHELEHGTGELLFDVVSFVQVGYVFLGIAGRPVCAKFAVQRAAVQNFSNDLKETYKEGS